MCMEDIRLGRDLESGVRHINQGLDGFIIVAPPDPLRTMIAFSTSADFLTFVRPRELFGVNGSGWALTTSNPTKVFTVQEFGKMVQAAWTADDAAQGATLTVWTSTLGKT